MADLDGPKLDDLSGLGIPGERVLLHCCCAPCSTAILEWMVGEGLRPGLFFSNSNIHPFEEYAARRDELTRLAASYGLEVIEDDYDHSAWLAAVKGLEREPERGARCSECFKFRLRRAAAYAAANGWSILTTTLASSRWKVLSQVDEAGTIACAEVSVRSAGSGRSEGESGLCEYSGMFMDEGSRASAVPVPDASGIPGASAASRGEEVLWWGRNWRKGGLQERRNALVKELGLYNQTFCGCEFSRKQD